MKESTSPFDSVCELAADPGLAGQALRQIPESVRREADKKAEPWKWLLSFPEISKGYRRLFDAAQSQRDALRRIAEIATGRGGIEDSWGQKLIEAIKAHDTEAILHAQGKVFASMWRYDHAESLLEHAKESPAIQAEIRKMADTAYEKARRKLGRTKADAKAKPVIFEPATITQKIAWTLVVGWLRNSGGFPGFCFFADDALSSMMQVHLKLPGLQLETLRETRQAIGLRKASIFYYTASKNKNGVLGYSEKPNKPEH